MEERLGHKSDNLDIYLHSISGSLDEKTAIVERIKSTRYEGARFLEVGSGGDSVAAMVERLAPDATTITIDVIDADAAVLDGLLDRHPHLLDTAHEKGVNITLSPMDATDMRAFESGSFEGINASSLVHEIFSYADGFRGVARFVSEASRLLAPEGVLFYRDPELHDPLVYAEATLHDPKLKALCLFYLANATGNNQVDTKPRSKLGELYTIDAVRIAYSDKATQERVIATATDLAGLRSDEIDFEKDMVVYAEHGVIKELMRHFLTFHQSSPYGTVYFTALPDGNKEVQYASSNTEGRWKDFIEQNDITMLEGKTLTPENYLRSQAAMHSVFEFMQGSVKLTLEEEQFQALQAHLPGQEVRVEGVGGDHQVHCSVDSLQLSLQYQQLQINGVLEEASFDNPVAFRFYQYLKQEARETYFYFTPDEMIAFVAEMSNRSNHGYLLVPSPVADDTNRTSRRPKYDEFLQQSLSVRALDPTQADADVAPSEKKRLIQFTKKTFDQGLEALDKLTSSQPHLYPASRRVYEHLLRSGTMNTNTGLADNSR